MQSPFDLVLGTKGPDFSIMGMHFKLGLYEYQTASAIEGLLNIIRENKILKSEENIESLKVVIYEPAYHIIGGETKKNPETR